MRTDRSLGHKERDADQIFLLGPALLTRRMLAKAGAR